MRSNYTNRFHILLVFLVTTAGAQPTSEGFKTHYTHASTNTIFPREMMGFIFVKADAYGDENMTVEYRGGLSNDKLTISIYPAGTAYEGRLRNEYLSTLYGVDSSSKVPKSYNFSHTVFESDDIIVNGLRGAFTDDEKRHCIFSVYECGDWFMKIRLTSNESNAVGIAAMEHNVASRYNPMKLTRLRPLNTTGKIVMASAAAKDPLLLGASRLSAKSKLDWANQNTAEQERKSGFPDLYLDMHVASTKSFLDFEKNNAVKFERTPATGNLIDGLNRLIADGFLEEYLMENFMQILIVSEGTALDMPGYKRWKTANTTPDFLFPNLYRDAYE